MQELVTVEANKDRKLLETVDEWLARKVIPLALIIIAVGIGFRIYYILACYLNPDEALHVGLARAAGFKAAYLKSLTQAHPPLLTIVLHFFMHFGSSELLVRIPSLIAGTLGVWFGFKWSERVFGTGVAIGVLMLLTFSPAMTFTAIEVRQYGLLMGSVCAALYGFERAFDELSIKWMAFGHACLYAAILSHYSALWITVTIGWYSILRLYTLRVPRRTWIAWAGFQTFAALLYVVLYFTHIKYMRSGWMQDFAVNNYLKSAYFYGGEQSLLLFIGSSFRDIFSYMIGIRSIGLIGLVLFVGGVIALTVISPKRDSEKRKDLSVLMAMPLLLGCFGAILHLLPFCGTRHNSYLLPFLAAGLSFFLFRWVKYSAVAAAIFCLIGPFWLMWTMGRPEMNDNNHPKWLPRKEIARALDFLSSEIPRNKPLIVDMQTSWELEYYLRNNGPIRLVEMNHWAFQRQNFIPAVRRAKNLYGTKPGETLWAISTGWRNFPPLKDAVPKGLLISAKQFGPISFVRFKMPSKAPEKTQKVKEIGGAGTIGFAPPVTAGNLK